MVSWDERHGGPVEEPPQDVFLSDDPWVGMVHADMGNWLRAHPCDCEALCECDAGPTPDNGKEDADAR